MKHLSIVLMFGLAAVSQCGAETPSQGCPGCGCSQMKKVCRLVPDVKKVPQTKYTVESEDVCLPGKSRCEERLVNDPTCIGATRYEKVQVPTCDRIVTKKKLKKVTTTVEKPGWKYVVDTVCCQCGCDCGPANCGK